MSDDDSLFRKRHTAAHVTAEAVQQLMPEARFGIGPPIDDGFYYDFDLPRTLTEDDLVEIERRAKALLRENLALERRELSLEQARAQFASQAYKLEIVDDLVAAANASGEELQLSTYRQGDFEDLCRGPHVASTGEIDADAFKLMSVAGAYWRGDASRPMLQRIYGTVWDTQDDLEAYLERLEQARRRDHRTLGKTGDLFSFSPDVGPGLVLWHPKGATVRYLAERFSQEAHMLNDYEWVYTPHIGKAALWETSGHLDFFRDAMFPPLTIDGDEYYLKPMSCPFHIQIFKSHPRSYRELPKRFAEYATVYRYELSGVLHGLTRARGFTQDDAHTFCAPEQAYDEVIHALRFSVFILRTFGFTEMHAYVATRPEGKAAGSEEDWDHAVETLRRAATDEGLPFDVDEGGGAFYGPKIDLKVSDALGREWQLSTVQFDFNLPERFDMTYTGSDGKPHRPTMIHRALFGSSERFMGVLLEHYGGAFPVWLAPVQVVLVPISKDQAEYSAAVADRLKASGYRVEVTDPAERMQNRIRVAVEQHVPYILVMGRREAEAGAVSVRGRDAGDLGSMSVEDLQQRLAEEIAVATPRRVVDEPISGA